MTKIFGIFAICFLTINVASAKEDIPQKNLPDALISLVFTMRSGSDILTDTSENENRRINRIYKTILKKLAGQGDDILVAFQFTDRFCKIQSGDRGHFCGSTEKILPLRSESFVFVTTPIKETGGKVFLITSSVSPEQTRILSFEEGAPARLLYDSHSKAIDNFCESPSIRSPLRSIYLLTVFEPGIFVLRESGNVPEKEGERTIVLRLTAGECSMFVVSEIPPTPRTRD